MSKEMFIDAHEQLIGEYLDKHPNATDAEAYDRTADSAYDRMRDNLADRVDSIRQRAKDCPEYAAWLRGKSEDYP